jgi:hypothetical protein
MTVAIKNISLETFRCFLRHNGLNLIRTKGGHEIWSGKNLIRPVILQSHIDPIPLFIINNCLRTMGLKSKDLRDYLMSKN